MVFAVLAAAPPVEKVPRVAVMELRALDAASRPQVELLQEVILTDLARTRRFDVVGKSDIDAMLGLERQKQLLGCADDASSCLAELGGALGADYVLLGSVARIDQTRRVDLKLLDAKENRVIAREYAMGATDSELLNRTREALTQLITIIPGGAAVVAAPAGPPLPWVGIGTTAAGGALMVGGGLVAALTTADFYARRTQLQVAEAVSLEGTKNLGLVGLGVGAAVTGVGLWLWLAPGSTTTAVLVPTEDGVMFSLGGSL
ncbi:MAG: DUF3280 domain-containing protein [Myxococcota bacterium]|nr:DUF3280 domain-containing protein [Myxococcota bacterium]